MDSLSNKQLSLLVANRTLALLDERKARLYPELTSFYVWSREERIVVIFDVNAIDTGKVNEDFAHRLSTRLQGRRVVRTNSRGLFLQVGYEIPPAKAELETMPLDLSHQPTPYHLPLGMSDNGELWRSLLDAISVFVVGVSGMGKSAMLHGFIQALLHGNQTLVYAWDGKDNAEYLRYVGRSNFTLFGTNELQHGLMELQKMTQDRWRILAKSGHPNIIEYNKVAAEPMMPIVLLIDEVAEVEDQEVLMRHVKVNRAAGLFPIFATNDPTKSAVIAKSNLQTRISMPVVSAADSVTDLGRTGAQNLPKKPGRGLIQLDGRLVEFQAFQITYPMPTQEALEWLDKQTGDNLIHPIEKLQNIEVEKIRDLSSKGKGVSAIISEIWGITGGGKYAEKSSFVKTVLKTSSSSSHETPENGLLGAV